MQNKSNQLYFWLCQNNIHISQLLLDPNAPQHLKDQSRFKATVLTGALLGVNTISHQDFCELKNIVEGGNDIIDKLRTTPVLSQEILDEGAHIFSELDPDSIIAAAIKESKNNSSAPIASINSQSDTCVSTAFSQKIFGIHVNMTPSNDGFMLEMNLDGQIVNKRIISVDEHADIVSKYQESEKLSHQKTNQHSNFIDMGFGDE